MPFPSTYDNLSTAHVDNVNEFIVAGTDNGQAAAVNAIQFGLASLSALSSINPVTPGPWPSDDAGWARDLLGTGSPTLGIARAPQLSLMSGANQLHLPQSVAACREAPPTTLQAQINGTASGGVLRLAPGYIYREAVTISQPIAILGRGLSSLRGSDDWSPGGIPGCTWTLSSGVYTSSLTVPAMALDAVQGAPRNSYAQQHRETVFLDGVPLQIANTAAPSATQFALDGSRHVILGTNPAGRRVEVATRSTLITTSGEFPVTFDGLDIRHVASSGTGQPTAIDLSSITTSAIYITNSMIGWAHGAGLNLGGKTNLFLENVIVHGCGTTGIAASGNTNPIYRRVVFFNNGQAVYGWDPFFGSGGIKEAGSSGPIFEKCVAFGNTGVGLWFDVLVTRGMIRECVAWDNNYLGGGGNISIEVSSFCAARDNVLFRTPSMPGGLGQRDIALFVSNSRWVECYGNVLMHCPLNFTYRWAPSRGDSPPTGSQDNTHMGGVSFHDNQVVGRYHPADQSFQSDVAEQWADDGSGTYTNVAGNQGFSNQFGYPAVINSGGSFLEVQQEPDGRWWHDGGGGNITVSTIANWRALQFGAASDVYMLEATRIGHLRRFGLVP